ncbi:hypothetical protein LR48_Vigan07g083600 [Vigna angularis]|uniref:Uncharacterized protein n=1 Tax=Phaseolus angularis TaxID=3914 RepID=A0A0L9UX36_PHAAN|nr:hypothetical protein LR48_Vigan07g083600 [Vigna angularis]
MPFDAFDCICLDLIEPVVNTAELIDSKVIKATFEIEHIDVSIAVKELYTDFDTISIDGSCAECDVVATESSHTSEVVFDELVQVNSEFDIATGIAEMHTVSNILHALPDFPDTSKHFKLLDTIFVVHHTNTPTDGCSDLNAYALDDLLNDYALTSDNYAKFDDLIVHIHLDLDVADDTFSAGTDLEEAVYTEEKKEVLVDAEEDANTAQGWNTQSQYLRTKDSAVIADILNAELKEAADLKEDKSTETFFLDEGGIANSAGSWKELMHILDDHGETPKTISHFFTFSLINFTHSHIEGNVPLKCGGGKV